MKLRVIEQMMIFSEDLIKNIKSTLGKNPNIIKYDLVDKNFYSENGKGSL